MIFHPRHVRLRTPNPTDPPALTSSITSAGADPHLASPDGHSCPEINLPAKPEEPAQSVEPSGTTMEAWKKRHFTWDEQNKEEISGDLAAPFTGGIPNRLAYAQQAAR